MMDFWKRFGVEITSCIVIALVLSSGYMFGPVATAIADDVGQLASQLARLRNEVESLTTELDTKKEDLRARLRSIASQKAELEMETQREKLRLRQLREAQKTRKERVLENEARNQTLVPILQRSIETVRAACQNGLPFKVDERLSDLDRLQRQLQNRTLTTPVVFAQLWSRVEDELRLAKENGLYKQVVTINGNEVLADVARIGMVMLFYRTKDGLFGRAVREKEGWVYRVYNSEEDRKRVAALFEALEKNIRVGYFELPPAFLEEERP